MFLSLFVVSSGAFAGTNRVLVSVIETNNDEQFKVSACEQIFLISQQVVSKKTDVYCRGNKKGDLMDLDSIQYRDKFDYQMRVVKDQYSGLSIDIVNWKSGAQDEFLTLGWKLESAKMNEESIKAALAKASQNIFSYVENEEAYKRMLLANGAHESKTITYDATSGKLKDALNGEVISVDKAYALYSGESLRKRNYLRAGVEIGVLLSSALAIYYKNLAYNKVDFDYGFKDGIEKKLKGEAILFDDNDKFANVGHAFAGVEYHQVARANGFKPLEAFLIDLGTSTMWEFMEYHEVLSINDEIITPVGGYVMGEAMFQASCALLAKGGVVNNTVAYALTPALGVGRVLDRKKTDKGMPLDCKKERWSKISAYVGLESGQKAFNGNDYKTPTLGFSTEVVTVPGYGKEGKGQGFIVDTALSQMLVESNGLSDLKIVSQIASAAYYKRKQEKDSKGEMRGYDFILALTHGYRHNDFGAGKDDKDSQDFYGTVNVIGATAHVNLKMKGYTIKAEVGFFGDFAMVKSYAINNYVAAGNNLSEEASVIRKRGYFWGLGTTGVIHLSASNKYVEAGLNLQKSQASNIAGRDRLSKNNPSDFKEKYDNLELYLTFKVTKKLEFKISHEIIKRQGSVNGLFDTSGIDKKTKGTLVYVF